MVDTIPSPNPVTRVVQVVAMLAATTMAGTITALPLLVDTVGATTVVTTTTMPLAVPLATAQVVPAVMVSCLYLDVSCCFC